MSVLISTMPVRLLIMLLLLSMLFMLLLMTMRLPQDGECIAIADLFA